MTREFGKAPIDTFKYVALVQEGNVDHSSYLRDSGSILDDLVLQNSIAQ